METIENEVWLKLEDGRLISMNKHAAPTMIGQGAELIPPERVVREGDGGQFVLLDENDKRVAQGRAQAEKDAADAAAKAEAEAAAAEDADEDEEEEEVAPATTESAAVAPPQNATVSRPSPRKPA